jgi:hypothetical protein
MIYCLSHGPSALTKTPVVREITVCLTGLVATSGVSVIQLRRLVFS